MCELVIKTAKQNGDLMHNNCKYFIYRGFEIIENPHSFNIYYENDKLLKTVEKDKVLNSQWSFEVAKGIIDKYLKENR